MTDVLAQLTASNGPIVQSKSTLFSLSTFQNNVQIITMGEPHSPAATE